MTRQEFFEKVYDVLVEHAKAPKGEKEDFVECHSSIKATEPGKEDHTEWRFRGALGFGGKFRTRPSWEKLERRFAVDCYPEDETPERDAMIAATNRALTALTLEHWPSVTV
jgi:hypothetical protein